MAAIDFNEKLSALKEELLKEIRNSESRNANKSKETETDLLSKIELLTESSEQSNSKIADLQNFNAMIQVKVVDRMAEMSKFKISTEDDLMKQNMDIGNFEKDFKLLQNKLDTIYLENLVIPGKIGEYCTYKNLREYIEVNFFCKSFF
jgi:hypothetical protein